MKMNEELIRRFIRHEMCADEDENQEKSEAIDRIISLAILDPKKGINTFGMHIQDMTDEIKDDEQRAVAMRTYICGLLRGICLAQCSTFEDFEDALKKGSMMMDFIKDLGKKKGVTDVGH